MKINFTKKQYRILLDLIFAGNYVINGIRLSDEAIEEYVDLMQYVYSFAKKLGCEDLIEYNKEFDKFYETSKYDKSGIHDLIEEYDNEVFWSELASNLAERDVEIGVGNQDMDHEEFITTIWRREEEYNDEFYKNGLDNVTVEMEEDQIRWKKINEDESEYVSEEELHDIEEIKLNGEFVDQDDVLKELGIKNDEI